MERVVDVNLRTYHRHCNLISKQQHGFLSGKSTITNILESLADWTLTLKNRHLIDILYVDFAKAFDTVCHRKLFYKRRSFGINCKLFKWIQDHITNRTQRTRRWLWRSPRIGVGAFIIRLVHQRHQRHHTESRSVESLLCR